MPHTIGDRVSVMWGASVWMRHNLAIPKDKDIDGVSGTITEDRTHLIGSRSHFLIETDDGESYAVHPMFIAED